ncbi:hypothetical protein FHS95_003765 [Sphingomonas naasensis]|uniref:Cysteine dioxygenase n=1 Tax=Sphingomonas naasensis TaxID=1344951 RepID=A0A4V3QWE6_9SPHN|nr:hypothetical protein [Sphingomonas naasensis]NIJ22054.1 hypothetical protein [Sphingomonas naasensis]TGX42272.1 hypothetical protein E5A74_10475 [Sphingomonas naasensis]
MTISAYETGGLLEAAAARVDAAGYTAIPWDRDERATIAAEALRRAVAALRDGGGGVIHPLGFARIPLSPWTLERPRFAVHVWSRDWPAGHALDIHDHCYDFVSICIAGEICHSFFEPCDSADALACEASRYQAGCCAETEGAPGERQRLALKNERTVAPYDALSLHHRELHRAWPLTDVAVTIQFQSPCIEPTARVFRAAGSYDQPKDESVKAMSREHLALVLESVGQ